MEGPCRLLGVRFARDKDGEYPALPSIAAATPSWDFSSRRSRWPGTAAVTTRFRRPRLVGDQLACLVGLLIKRYTFSPGHRFQGLLHDKMSSRPFP